MKKIGLILVAGFSIFFAASPILAQSDDPSEVFLKAYMTSQQGEKLERENNFREALSKYRFAGSLLEELRKNHADWQPAIVEYRSRKIGENILRAQGKMGTQRELTATAPSGSTPAPAAPTSSGGSTASSKTSKKTVTAAPVDDEAIKEATRKLRARVEDLQKELRKSRTELSAAQKQKESVSEKLEQTTAKLTKAQKDAETSKKAESEVRTQLTKAQDSLGKLRAAGKGVDGVAAAALRNEIAQLKKSLATAEAGKASAEKDKTDAQAKLEDSTKQLAGAKQERDTAIAQLKGSKDAQDHVQALIAQNSALTQKLAAAEKTVREIGADKPKKEQELIEVRRQLDALRQQLAASKKQNQDFEVSMADLRNELDDATGELEKTKLAGGSSEETQRLTKENDLLRGIVMREREEEARREAAKTLMLAEFDKLKIKSDVITKQVQLLAQPIAKLSPEELSLFRQPVVAVSDSKPNVIQASFAAPKNTARSTPIPVTITNPDEKKSDELQSLPPAPEADSGQPPAGPSVETTFTPGVPKDLIPMARAAKDNFDRGKYRAAEREYHEILAKSPNNLYSLSNLGVVLFRSGKLKAAELTLKKAITIAPKDEFSRTTLGIVYYRQSKFDDALTELTKALAINPKSATAHNYLGITASQKGWQEAAEKEMLDAIAANPDYADAHFNLAVIYATANPPAKELAKRHYDKAVALGAERDPAMEKMLK